jgi:RNA recognition motif-containing protein
MKGSLVSKRLFIGSLSFEVSEEDLRTAFTPYGVSDIVTPTSQGGQPKGFGFVEVESDQAQAAISAMDGKELHGRAIAVSEARPKPEGNRGYGNSGGGSRGGYGGGRGGRW